MDYDTVAALFFIIIMLQVIVIYVILFHAGELIYEQFEKMRKKDEEEAAEEAERQRLAEAERADQDAFEAWRATQIESIGGHEALPSSRLEPDPPADTGRRKK